MTAGTREIDWRDECITSSATIQNPLSFFSVKPAFFDSIDGYIFPPPFSPVTCQDFSEASVIGAAFSALKEGKRVLFCVLCCENKLNA